MRSVLSGVTMRINPVIADNAYGVFGYATGSLGKSGSCVYAWQFAKNIRPYDGGQFATSGGAAQIRLRYCSPSIAADRIVALMQGLRLNPASSQGVQMLGYAAAPGAFAPVPFTEQEARSVERETSVAAPARRVKRPAVAEHPSTETVAAEPTGKVDATIANAVKVPMPGEAAAMAAAEPVPVVAQPEVSKVAAKPSFVPLPATVARVAQ